MCIWWASIILPVVLYGYETWSVTLREEYRLQVFENRVLRKIFGPMRDEVTGERRLRNEELCGLYSPNIIWVIKSRIVRWVVLVAHMGNRRDAYRVLVGRLEGKRPLGRIGIDLHEVGWGGMDWIGLAQDRDRWRALVNVVTKIQVP
jgi:hypothetical protein